MADDKWSQPAQPPPPLFVGEKERNLVKQVNDELIERVVGQQVVYYPIDHGITQYNDLYGEAIEKNYLPPVQVYVLIEWNETTTTATNYGLDRIYNLTCHFHKRRLTEDQDLYAREGDFILYGEDYYEIITLSEPKQLFGQTEHMLEISAKCSRARQGLFDGK